ncbi:hypothetical protein M9Y10_045635 [Tritrichomonas musculus]|uniref:Uncharacterized protein n=1 Tax=Tritrichomonas musculus TaxID=1915356 RepID=A0ABR2JWI2_9EUKA
MSLANSKSPPSVKSLSVASSGRLSASVQKKKRSQLPPQQASLSFSQRFQSIFFSLYNPQDREKLIYDTLPPIDLSVDEKNQNQSNDEFPEFNSPLCAYKIKTDIEENKSTRDQLLQAFHVHSSQLVNELSLKEYDKIEVSMVPFDVERTGDDRSHKEQRRQADERIKEIQDSRSMASYKSRDIAKKKQLEEAQQNYQERHQKYVDSRKDMKEEPYNYSSPSLAKKKIKKEESDRRSSFQPK